MYKGVLNSCNSSGFLWLFVDFLCSRPSVVFINENSLFRALNYCSSACALPGALHFPMETTSLLTYNHINSAVI